MYIKLPCSNCGEMTEFACSSCRQPMCVYCTRAWPAANGKPGATRGYRCLACEKGLRQPVKAKRFTPTVTRHYFCGCGAEIAHVTTKRWTLADEERVKWSHQKHQRQAKCLVATYGCEFSYSYDDDDPRAKPNLRRQATTAKAHRMFHRLLDDGWFLGE